MPLSFNAKTTSIWNEAYRSKLPEKVLIDTRCCHPIFQRLEDHLSDEVNADQWIFEIAKCLKVAATCDLEITMFCLELQDQHGIAEMPGEMDYLFQCVEEVGERLHSVFQMHRLYRRGEMPYRVWRSQSGTLELLRFDIYLERLNHELDAIRPVSRERYDRFAFA